MPDAPINLVNLPDVTDANNIGFAWTAGASDGGNSVIDHKIWYALEGSAFTELEFYFVGLSYTTSVELQDG